MASTFSPNLHLEEPARGDYTNTWDLPANANYGVLDTAYGGTATITVTGGNQTINLTQAQANAQFLVVNGTLTGGFALIVYPAVGGGRKYVLNNVTQGANTLYVRGGAGADTHGILFNAGFGIPCPFVVYPNRVYWDYGSCYPGSLGDFSVISTIPPGWIPCDGRSLPVAFYDLLFDFLGYSNGGSGANFNIPDWRGYAAVCADNVGTGSAGRFFNAAPQSNFGATTTTLTVPQLPSHNHPDSGHAHTAFDSGHAHTEFGTITGGSNLAPGAGFQLAQRNTGVASANIVVNPGVANNQPAGGNQPFNIVQPSRTLVKMIRF